MSPLRLFAILAVLFAFAPSSAFANPIWCTLSINGHPVFDTTPSVTRFAPASVSPGSNVVVSGQHFGPLPNKVILHIPDNSTGHDLKKLLTINSWDDTLITATIPTPITGVIAQPNVNVEIINICGHSSLITCPPDSPSCTTATWQVNFIPDMDMQQVPEQNITCSMTSHNSGDVCMGENARFPIECPGLTTPGYPLLLPGPGVFLGLHNSGWGGGNNGTDTYTVNNLHGTWSVQSVGSFDFQQQNGSNHTSASLNYPGTGSTWSVKWSEDSCTSIGYAGIVTMTGPVGVSF